MAENSLGLLTRAEAEKLFPFGRRGFESLIKKGEIGFKKVNKRYYFLRSELERWAENLEHRIEFTSEAKPIGRISHSCPQQEKKYSLDALVRQMNQEKLNNSVYKKLQNYKKQPRTKQAIDYLA